MSDNPFSEPLAAARELIAEVDSMATLAKGCDPLTEVVNELRDSLSRIGERLEALEREEAYRNSTRH